MNRQTKKKIILASASPRRKFLLGSLGLEFDIIPSDKEEWVDPGTPPDEAVRQLAYQKASDIASNIDYPAIIIGADTTVVIDGLSLGKPIDAEDAFNMLKTLSGRTHTVITGYSIIDTTDNRTVTSSISSEVTFKKLSDEDIRSYIKSGEPMDKAGAYAIQGVGSVIVAGIEGCYNNIVGLPLFKLAEDLKQFGIDILTINATKEL